MKNGLLLGGCGTHAIRLRPSLVFERRHAEEFLDLLSDTMRQVWPNQLPPQTPFRRKLQIRSCIVPLTSLSCAIRVENLFPRVLSLRFSFVSFIFCRKVPMAPSGSTRPFFFLFKSFWQKLCSLNQHFLVSLLSADNLLLLFYIRLHTFKYILKSDLFSLLTFLFRKPVYRWGHRRWFKNTWARSFQPEVAIRARCRAGRKFWT